ncbi:MAG TPA: antitoxin family protein [Phycisphaerae bacterium]|jgi:predicted DNA-binding antitoxin AbrB/MazE fold protein
MDRVVEAIYTNGMFRPLDELNLPEQARVELTVRSVEPRPREFVRNGEQLPEMEPTEAGREAALAELFEEIDRLNLQLRVRMPTREELHERG